MDKGVASGVNNALREVGRLVDIDGNAHLMTDSHEYDTYVGRMGLARGVRSE